MKRKRTRPAPRPDTWMPIFWGDYARDTGHLDESGHGAYLMLIKHYWCTGQPLPDDDVLLARIACCATPSRWKRLRPLVEPFFQVVDGRWNHKRIKAELEFAVARLEDHERGSAGGHAKWGSRPERETAATRSERLSAAREKGRHTPEEWLALVAVCGELCVRCGADGKLVKDHVKPIYQGGSDAVDNLQPLCVSCNGAKGPDSTDWRPKDWWERLQKRLLAGITTPANACQNVYPSPSPSPTQSQKPAQQPNGRDSAAPDFRVVGERCCELAAIDTAKSGVDFSPVLGWLKAGFDVEADIVPAIERMAARPGYKPPGSLNYFTKAIREAHQNRTEAERAGSTVRNGKADDGWL